MTDRRSDLVLRLQRDRGLVALISCLDSSQTSVSNAAAAWLGFELTSLAREAFSEGGFNEQWHPAGDTVVDDIDLLFTPALSLDPLSHLRRMGRSVALVAVWPGRIDGGRLTYSEPGRSDHYDVPAKHVLVLDPVETHFPDEDPYTAEYYPA